MAVRKHARKVEILRSGALPQNPCRHDHIVSDERPQAERRLVTAVRDVTCIPAPDDDDLDWLAVSLEFDGSLESAVDSAPVQPHWLIVVTDSQVFWCLTPEGPRGYGPLTTDELDLLFELTPGMTLATATSEVWQALQMLVTQFFLGYATSEEADTALAALLDSRQGTDVNTTPIVATPEPPRSSPTPPSPVPDAEEIANPALVGRHGRPRMYESAAEKLRVWRMRRRGLSAPAPPGRPRIHDDERARKAAWRARNREKKGLREESET